MLKQLREDIACILQRDPAARSTLEVLTCYPGLHAILVHRLAHRLWNNNWFWLARFCSHLGRMLTSIEIHPGARIGRRVFIDHGFGVVVGETAEIGDDCTIYQGVTLGGTRLYKGEKRHPTLESGVVVGAGAQVLGGFTVGSGARIGSNAVVVKPVPAGATVVGNPARLIVKDQPEQAQKTSPATDSPCQTSVWDSEPLQDLLRQRRAEPDMSSDHPAFEAYAVGGSSDDPVAKVLHELIDHTARQDARIHKLCQALEELGQRVENGQQPLDAERLNKMVQ
ncbi:serine O-acetyltransferase [Alcaligenes sp. SDU_A2]|uniref:serine O-acetyltransferase n=1 Tax=Alcaligenes sp. SDU_A2 TaxID=3136634 RepID=UPI00311E9B90